MSLFKCLLFVALLATGTSTAFAVNPSFYPGDAFFTTAVNKAWIDSLSVSEGSVKCSYQWPEKMEFFLCGYNGFDVLELSDVSDEVQQNFQNVYVGLRECTPAVIRVETNAEGKVVSQTEANPFRLLIYNAGYNFKNYGLGLRYNETWSTPPESGWKTDQASPVGPFGSSVRASEENGNRKSLGVPNTRYLDFIGSPKAVVEDWKYATKIVPLEVEVPKKFLWALPGEKIDAPVRISADKTRFLMVHHNSLRSHFDRKKHNPIFEINDTAILVHEYVQHEWQTLSWDEWQKHGFEYKELLYEDIYLDEYEEE
ncbi:hypothetical protein [Calycomorphotria hydatis]|uniref:Uncharacterized protein n=1 Tax=Calycomorphotria hydatis TaxID=2528027 RepID=A0A517T3M3_9PLAN|nr:hypothetical protein [Calycomorphotria hydatis]QDT62941.1 hypothetical protein V22_01390 [Calycomorphotria hydatis]